LGNFAAPALLTLTLGGLAWFQRNDVKNFELFSAIEDTRRRQRTFLKWAAKSCAFYLGMPLAGLALFGRLDALWDFPREFWTLAAPLPLIGVDMLAPMAVGAVIGIAIVAIAFAIRSRLPRRQPKPAKRVRPALKIQAMMPRNRAEALHQLPLILNAGVSEEIFFRLYLPLLMVWCGIDALVSYVAASLIFGVLHRYQGLIGIVLTAVVGALLALAYLACAGLWLPVLLHLVLNSNSLLLRPAIKRFTARRAD